jgi:hypothetical protein
MKQIRSFPVFIVLIFCTFALVSCEDPLTPPKPAKPDGGFWAYSEKKGYYVCPSVLLAEGRSCLIYGETAKNIDTAAAQKVADKFDNSIYATITGAFGSPSDVDNNGKIIILLLDIEEKDTMSGYIAGYFDPNDLFYRTHSNLGEILYIDTINIKDQIVYPVLYTTTAHEFQHLINRSLHMTKPMDVWIDEGLASAAEHLYGGPHYERITHFNDDSSGTIRRGNNFFVWNGYWEEMGDALSNYSTVYLFFQWLGIHANNGSAIYGEIINSSYTNYQAVTRAAQSHIPELRLGDDPELNWETLLGSWYAANHLRKSSGSADSIYGYKNEIALNFTWSWPESNHTVSLYPSEGVYSNLPSPVPSNISPTAHIRYSSLNNPVGKITISNTLPNSAGPLLTFNSNTVAGGVESGYAADRLPVSSSRLRAAVSSADDSAMPDESPEETLKRWDGGRIFLENRDAAIGADY